VPLAKPDIYLQTVKLDPYLTPHAIISSKWITDLQLRPNTIKLFEENITEASVEWVWQ
jgi:hypothetical protein